MNDAFKDQLKAAARSLKTERDEAEAAARVAKAKAEAEAKARAEDERQRRERGEGLSDEELFARAVGALDSGAEAILAKYDETDPKRRRPAGPSSSSRANAKPTAEQERQMFLDAVSDIDGTPPKR